MGGAPEAGDVHVAARRGTSGGAGPLPFFDRIQRLFGHHDLSGIQAHVGGEASEGAAAMGAHAYATGDRIAFAKAPDLRTAAHEAAHVVQQRGGVSLAGGVGEAGDAHERHADEVAERVVAGQSAQDLLDRYASPKAASAPGTAVQRIISGVGFLGSIGPSSGQEKAEFLDRHAFMRPIRSRYLEARIEEDATTPVKRALAGAWEVDPDPEELVVPHQTSQHIVQVLGQLLSSGNYIFSNPPLDSSGDIYHTVGFLALLRASGITNLPRVVIGYLPGTEGEDHKTKKQAKRGVEFAEALGFGDQVTMLQVNTESKWQKGKLSDQRQEIGKTTDGHHPILDQKVSTGLIAMLVDAIGHDVITKLLRRHLARYQDVEDNTQEHSDEWQEAQIAKIHDEVGTSRFVLLNERIADNQDQHNTSGEDFEALESQLEEQKIAIYRLRSHDKKPTSEEEESTTTAFTGTGREGKLWGKEAPGFNTKVQHLQLLVRIRAVFGRRLVGMIGSTSGTTDAAALIGIPTLSLHQFSIDNGKKTTKTLNEQDQRELLMEPFKYVVRRGPKGERGSEENVERLGEELESWQDGEEQGELFYREQIPELLPVYTRTHSLDNGEETEGKLPRGGKRMNEILARSRSEKYSRAHREKLEEQRRRAKERRELKKKGETTKGQTKKGQTKKGQTKKRSRESDGDDTDLHDT